MIRRPPRSTRTDTRFPDTTLFRSQRQRFRSVLRKNLLNWKYFDIPSHAIRSAEHTSELQSLMRISYAVFCLTKTKLSPPLGIRTSLLPALENRRGLVYTPVPHVHLHCTPLTEQQKHKTEGST